jgi:RNA polymerase sigma factor (sigma-70 family)
MLWAVEHPNKLAEWLGDKGGENAIRQSFRNVCLDYGQRQKAAALGSKVDDVYYWGRTEIEEMLPAMFDHDKWVYPPQPDGPTRSQSAPDEGGNWVAALSDLSQAFARLDKEDRDLLTALYGESLTQSEAAVFFDVKQPAISKRHDRAIKRLHRLLGGGRGGPIHDRVDCECVGHRRAMSNAEALARTRQGY